MHRAAQVALGSRWSGCGPGPCERALPNRRVRLRQLKRPAWMAVTMRRAGTSRLGTTAATGTLVMRVTVVGDISLLLGVRIARTAGMRVCRQDVSRGEQGTTLRVGAAPHCAASASATTRQSRMRGQSFRSAPRSCQPTACRSSARSNARGSELCTLPSSSRIAAYKVVGCTSEGESRACPPGVNRPSASAVKPNFEAVIQPRAMTALHDGVHKRSDTGNGIDTCSLAEARHRHRGNLGKRRGQTQKE